MLVCRKNLVNKVWCWIILISLFEISVNKSIKLDNFQQLRKNSLDWKLYWKIPTHSLKKSLDYFRVYSEVLRVTTFIWWKSCRNVKQLMLYQIGLVGLSIPSCLLLCFVRYSTIFKEIIFYHPLPLFFIICCGSW